MPRLPSPTPVEIPRFGGALRAPEVVDPGLRQAGRSLAGMGEALAKEKIKDDKFNVEDATTRLQQSMLDLRKGEGGYSHVKSGDVSKDFHNEWMDRFDQSRKEIEDSLGNDEQKEMFSRRGSVYRVGYGENLINHITGERNTFNEQVYKGGIETERDLASSDWDNESVVNTALLRTKKLTEDHTGRLGIKGALKKDMLKENISSVHESVIKNAVDENIGYAKEWYQKNKKNILGERHDEIEKLLKSSGVREESQEAVDDYVARGLTETEAKAEARKKFSGEVEDSILSRISNRYAEAKQALDRKQALFGEDARSAYADAIDQGLPAEDAYDAISTEDLKGMDGAEKISLQKTRNAAAKNESVRTDRKDYTELMDMMKNDPNKFKEVSLYKYQLSETDFKSFTKAQTDPQELIMARSKARILSDGAAKVGLKASGRRGKTMRDKVVAYNRRVEEELKAFQLATGKKATPKDIDEITDRLAIEIVRNPGRFFGLFEGERPAISAEIEGVPTDMIDEIAQTLVNMGEPVTDENIRRGYAVAAKL